MWLRSGTAVTVAWATAAALIQPLAGERPYATCMALKKQKAEEKKKKTPAISTSEEVRSLGLSTLTYILMNVQPV